MACEEKNETLKIPVSFNISEDIDHLRTSFFTHTVAVRKDTYRLFCAMLIVSTVTNDSLAVKPSCC